MRRTAVMEAARRGPLAGRMRPAATSREHAAVRMQRALGNRGVESMLKTRLEARLSVGPAYHHFEDKADRVAGRALRTSPAEHAMPSAHEPRIQGLGAEREDKLRPDHAEAVVAKTHPGTVSDPASQLDGRIRALGSGQPLPPPTRALFEPRFGWNFRDVRVHTDGAAAAAASGVRAQAFTLGRDIVFGAGEYAPNTTAGRSLLAHELAHVVQQARGRADPHVSAAQAEREANVAAAPRGHVPLSARPIAVHRQPNPPQAGMTRNELGRRLRAIFGHDVPIEVGDRERQTRELGGPRDRRRLPDDWQAWDPGASSPLYDEILGAVLDVGREIGGVPDIRQIVFYNVRYDYDDQLNVVADTNAAAQITTRRVMYIYRAARFETEVVGSSSFRSSGVFLASGRSTAGRKGASAPMGAATRAESQRRSVAHELGHGVEWASGALREFEQAVGWVRVGGELRLYDIQARGVKQAIARGAEPPAAARITKRDWNSGAHLEQPMREYAVSHSAEDFADSLMAWLYARDALKARSPARFNFFDDQTRRRSWLPKLVTSGAPTRTAP